MKQSQQTNTVLPPIRGSQPEAIRSWCVRTDLRRLDRACHGDAARAPPACREPHHAGAPLNYE